MNYSAKTILEVLRKERNEENNIIKYFVNKTGLQFQYAHGNTYLKIEEVFTEENTNLINNRDFYGGLNFLGNINNKTEKLLFFKNELLKKEVERYRKRIDMLRDEIRETIKYIQEQHGKTDVQISILSYKLIN